MILWIWLACASGDEQPKATGDSGETVDSFCEDVPLVTYETFGQGFIIENCQSCHASTSTNRYGAPESIHFDTYEEIIATADDILAEVTGDNPQMPSAGGVDEDKRMLLQIWLECWEDRE